MTGVDAAILRLVHSAMGNASGWLLDADLLASMWLKVATTSCATVSSVLMLLSAMELINTSSNGQPNTTEDFGELLLSQHGGHAWATGCLHSTSDISLYLNPLF